MRGKRFQFTRLAILVGLPLLLLSNAEGAGVAAPAPLHAGAFNPLSVDRTKTRIFMPLRNVQVKKRVSKVTGWQLEVTSDAPGLYTLERSIDRGALHHLRIQSFENKTYIRADWRYAAPVDVNVRPGGLEIFFYHQKAEAHFASLAPGVRYWEGQRWNGAGPMRVHVLKLDPRRVRLAPAIAAAGTRRMGLTTVSRLARAHGAIAAVNGGFFSPRTGEPQGTLVVNRNVVSRTMLDRPSLWIEESGEAAIRVEKPSASIRLDDGNLISCQGVNEAARRNRITLFTAHHGRSTRTISDNSRWEQAISPAGLVVAEGHGNVAIPKGGYVLSGQGYGASTLKKSIGFGQEIQVQFSLRPEVTDALGGGPTLIHQDQIKVLARQQHFRTDVATGRAPRTAFGIMRDGRYLLVNIDGHRPGYSTGATLSELAHMMRELGAIEAMNLDGGGSSTMWARGQTLNKPSDGVERPVSTALLVLPREQQATLPLDRFIANNPE